MRPSFTLFTVFPDPLCIRLEVSHQRDDHADLGDRGDNGDRTYGVHAWVH